MSRGRVGLRHTFELLRQPVEAGVDLAKFLPRQRGFALELGFAFALAASRRQFIVVTIVSMARSAARRRLVLFRAAAASSRAAIGIMCLARIVRRWLAALVVAPSLVVVVISGPHRLAMIVVLADDAVQPFPDRHAGTARRVAGDFARFWTEASQVPRTARFHCAPSHSGRNEMTLY